MLGIIPAGGMASRWYGHYKELLPVADNEWIIDRAFFGLLGAGVKEICVVTSLTKIQVLTTHLQAPKYADTCVYYKIQTAQKQGLWGAIKLAYDPKQDYFFMAMPDTYLPKEVFFEVDTTKPLNMGVFDTRNPERFGVVLDNKILDKQLLPPGDYQAWGVLAWSKTTFEMWLESGLETMDQLLTLSLQTTPVNTFPLPYYYDFARFEDYYQWLKSKTY